MVIYRHFNFFLLDSIYLEHDDVELGQEVQRQRHVGGQGQADTGRDHLTHKQ